MIVEIKVPELGESINEVEIGEWLVEIGDKVNPDEEIVAIESDKATVELPAPEGGVLVDILKKQGASATIGEVIGHIDTEKGEGAKESEKQETVKEKGVRRRRWRKKVMPSLKAPGRRLCLPRQEFWRSTIFLRIR